MPLLNLGTNERPTFFPAEIVTIVPGQTVKAKLTGSETTDMLAFACHSPHFNASHISGAGRITLGLDNGSLKPFGISASKNLLTVTGRQLPTPGIAYFARVKQPKPMLEKPSCGSWNMRGVRVVKSGKPINNWGYIVLHGRSPRPVDFEQVMNFTQELKAMGIAINERFECLNPQGSRPSMHRNDFLARIDAFFGAMKKAGKQFLLFVIDEKDSSGLYAQIKIMGDCKYGIHTSVVISTKFVPVRAGAVNFGAQKAYFANVALKWNLKAGGVNHSLSEELPLLKENKTMVVGYDVTHPTNMPLGKESNVPSIAGLVSSIDKNLGQWPAASWEQTSRQEMLRSRLVEVFKSRLDLWVKHSKTLPENILIFRDGVSEGQFAQVLDQELPSFREACKAKYGPKGQPRFTIVVSVKRHQTRFYPTDPAQKTKSGNVQPGTVVDRGVTQARYWDFFLTAHDALQGTARPAHYTVLLDEIFRDRYQAGAANELERVTHQLCYLYGRATKAVSICPPAYYADIVCERARAHRPDLFEVDDVMSVQSGAGGGASTASRVVHPDLRDTMYYI